MKNYTYLIFLIAGSFTLYAGPSVSITDLEIISPHPTVIDDILIHAEGGLSNIDIPLTHTEFRSEDELFLDLYFDPGYLTALGSWDHVENIGKFEYGTYNLTIQAFHRITIDSDYMLNDTLTISFEVVPEPTSVLLLGLGCLVIRKRKQ